MMDNLGGGDAIRSSFGKEKATFASAPSLVDSTYPAELRGGEAVDRTMLPPKSDSCKPSAVPMTFSF